MKFELETWTIGKLIDERDSLLLTPRYQRGEAWKIEKQALLIDSVLMGYAIPKLYLSVKKSTNNQSYDVVDGQQRLRAIFAFYVGKGYHNETPLILKKSWGMEWSDDKAVSYQDLSNNDKKCFLDYEVAISMVRDATNDQLRRIFLRLQMGSTLNQAELRNAIASSIGDHINAIVENHAFFKHSGIPETRFKRADLLAHVILAAQNFESDFAEDLSAEHIKELYLAPHPLKANFWKKVDAVLDCMNEINQYDQGIFSKKWMFVDFFMLFWSNFDLLQDIASEKAALQIRKLDNERVEFKDSPEELLIKKHPNGLKLFGYISAFYKDGGLHRNFARRLAYLKTIKPRIL